MAHLDADLAVTLEDDRPGTLARALGCVSAAGINIEWHEFRKAHTIAGEEELKIIQDFIMGCYDQRAK